MLTCRKTLAPKLLLTTVLLTTAQVAIFTVKSLSIPEISLPTKKTYDHELFIIAYGSFDHFAVFFWT